MPVSSLSPDLSASAGTSDIVFAVGKGMFWCQSPASQQPRPSRMQLGFIDEHVPAGDLHMVRAPVCH